MAQLNFKNSEVINTSPSEKSWNILIVDDNPEIHIMSRLVMKGWKYRELGFHLLFASSSEQAKKILQEKNLEISLILLDVVMENDNSGLELVRYIRDILKNKYVQIILRTGQPGKAPVRKVISEYDINDYKEKSELTADKLFVTVTAALRSYELLQKAMKNNI